LIGTNSGEMFSFILYQDSVSETADYRKENKNIVLGEGPFS